MRVICCQLNDLVETVIRVIRVQRVAASFFPIRELKSRIIFYSKVLPIFTVLRKVWPKIAPCRRKLEVWDFKSLKTKFQINKTAQRNAFIFPLLFFCFVLFFVFFHCLPIVKDYKARSSCQRCSERATASAKKCLNCLGVLHFQCHSSTVS